MLGDPFGAGQGGQAGAADVGGADVGDVEGQVGVGRGGLAGGAVGAALEAEAALVAGAQAWVTSSTSVPETA